MNVRLDARLLAVLVFYVSAISSPNLLGQQAKEKEPPRFDRQTLDAIAFVFEKELKAGNMPGCVIVVGSADGIAYSKAFGHRSIEPVKIKMTLDTVFDLASLSKPVVTAMLIHRLVEQNKLNLNDRVAEHWPQFAANGKDKVTFHQLLTHTSGLIADNSLNDYKGSRKDSLDKIANLALIAEPGEKFIYSDVGFIVLAELAVKIAGKDLDQLFHEEIAVPLSLSDTMFNPTDSIARRCAPTEKRDDQWNSGAVHDPRAFALNGVAGHAGLFSTGADLARFARCLLQGGRIDDIQIIDRNTILQMIRPVELPILNGRRRGFRSLGWDVASPYSSNKGDLLSTLAFGHGGFTGTGLWIDPEKDFFVVFLSSRLHPHGKGSVNPLIARIGNIAAKARTKFGNSSQIRYAKSNIKNGIDVLVAENFKQVSNQKIGLITNHTGQTNDGHRTIDVLSRSDDVELVCIFSPEHGIKGIQDKSNIKNIVDQETDLPVYSLYGPSKKPSPIQLQTIDTLVFDIQDVGTRFYTYVSTMALAMEAAAEQKKRFVVLDRPNPLGGTKIEGPILDPNLLSFVGFHPIPVRHGMTVGELAQMYAAEKNLELDLKVVKVENWSRGDWFDQLEIPWVNPSPNIRSLKQATLYPGIGLLETTNLSVGRGTDMPFEIIGAPWIGDLKNAKKLADELNLAKLNGVHFLATAFKPDSSKFAGEDCFGVFIQIINRKETRPVDIGIEVAIQLRKHFPDAWNTTSLNRLLGNRTVLNGIVSGRNLIQIKKEYSSDLDKFLRRREPYLLYK